MGGSLKNATKKANELNAPTIKPPSGMIPAEKKIWRETIQSNPHLNSRSYAVLLEAFCTAVRRLREARALVDQEGLLSDSLSGGVKKNPAVTVENSCLIAVGNLSVKLGIAAPSRGRVGATAKIVPEKPKEKDARTQVKGKPKLRIA